MTEIAPMPTVDSRRGRSRGESVTMFMGKYGALMVLALLVVVFTSQQPKYFLTYGNMLQIFNQSALTAIIACGLTLVLAANQFDLSVGNVASLSGIAVAAMLIAGVPIAVAIIIAILLGLCFGFVNAFLITRLGVNSLVATLGVGSVAIGVNYLISGGAAQPFAAYVPEFTQISVGTWFGIPKNVYYMVVVVAILWVVLNRTVLGRNIQAVGGNAEASRLVGVPVGRVTTAALLIGSITAAITGILLASMVGSGQATGGDGFTLQAMTAAFLGTAVMREGQFHILGTVVGVVTVATGFNGLAIIGVPTFAQFLFQGLVLIAAVSFSTVARKLTRAG